MLPPIITQAEIDSYRQLLEGMNINVGSLDVSLFSAQGDFAMSRVNDASTIVEHFDIGNKMRGNIADPIPSNEPVTFYRGALYITDYLDTISGGVATTQTWLTGGPNTSLPNFLFKKKSSAVIEDVASMFVWDDVVFRFIRKALQNSIVTPITYHNTEWLFVGRKISVT